MQILKQQITQANNQYFKEFYDFSPDPGLENTWMIRIGNIPRFWSESH